MMIIVDTMKDEKKLLMFTYILCIVFFLNLDLIKPKFDMTPMVIALVICFLIGFSYFIIRKFFPNGDKYIFIFACILSVIGIAMLYRIDILNGTLHALDVSNGIKKPHIATNNAVKQIIWFLAGVTGYILLVVLLPDLKRFAKLKYVYAVFTIIFMGMAMLIGTEVNGSKNWVFIGGFSFQPSEFGKLFLIAYLASALENYKDFKSLIEPAIIVMISLGFMVMQKDLGTALIIFAISVTMLYIATSKLKYTITCIILFVLGAFLSYHMFDHVRVRFLIWENPMKYANKESYQVVQSMISIAWGGLTGTGIGLGYPNYVPVNSTDFIFAIICEELGILMGMGIILIFFLLFYRCMRAAVYTNDNFSRLLAVGYASMVASQVMVIVGGVTNMIPLTGITLPLVSYGGSSMLITFFSLGIIQKISEEGR
jgi:cell division protein FtsW (lipid II flippase)